MMQNFHSDPAHMSRLAWQFGLLLFAFSGCGHHEEDQDHHLGHLIPAHKPESFAVAVTELKSRGPAVFSGQATDDARRELLDILDWLPELAADSDLKRKQWEQVRDTGIELRQVSTRPAIESSLLQWNELVDELAVLVPASDTWSQQRHTEDDSTSTSTNQNSSASKFADEVHHD